jgi:predicted anti-sigma-YlaC factor YlaD
VDCETCREALSARLDGEAEPVPPDEHLRACVTCQDWLCGAEELTRVLRVRTATAVPDLSAAILDRVTIDPPGWGPRVALGAVAAAQVGLALSQALGVAHTVDSHGAAHLFNESTAWNLALGVGLLWASLRPRAAAGMIPVLTAFVLALVAYSTYDLLTQAAPVVRVATHGLLVAGLCLLLVVNRQDGGPRGADQADLAPAADSLGATEPPAPATGEDRPHRRSPLRPAGRHEAA